MSVNAAYAAHSVEEDPLLVAEDDFGISGPMCPPVECAVPQFRLYKRRWYILLLFSLVGLVQCAVWNMWGPIAATAFEVYPTWNDATISLLSNWGNICFVLFLGPMVWVMEAKGLRNATVLSAGLLFVGTGVRLLSRNPSIQTWLIHIGHFLNGIAGIVLFSGPPQVSATWFPPNQRTTATGLICVFSSIGVAMGSLLGPYVLHCDQSKNQDKSCVDVYRHQIYNLMVGQFVISGVLFGFVLAQFPARPPSPPSVSATTARTEFWKSIRHITKNVDIWLIGVSFGIATSIPLQWLTVMYLNLQVLNVSQKEAGILGFYVVMAGAVAAILSSRKVFVDLFCRHMKVFLLVGLLVCLCCFLWMTALIIGLQPFNWGSLYVSVIIGGAVNAGLQPVFLELGAEVGFPTGEAVIGGFLTGIFNIVGTIFLLVFYVPNVGTLWMDWCLIGAEIVCIPMIALVREKHLRSAFDSQRTTLLTTDA